ncbi:ApaLI family restriction endonuclease [Xanthomonas campestris pv. badrii]|uniref:ApaLI family restriction endonuclease n=2 Tax=Xanthomonas campestris TaxID=339 RepID=A0A7Z2ZH15_XANCA|nr:ApaLI family restriction endonuclease [Xanthomonas campestris]AAC08983.1 restriction endonuclease R.XbaI [Xanthomonas campestris]QJD68039.1 ApaLI family restriction endonuclease [Xanthomonas campestris pv. badrii]
MTTLEKIKLLADGYADRLKLAIDGRVLEMQGDDVSHYLIYRVLGVAQEEGRLIDVYQNKGRFLYKYAGSFLEAATKLCFKEAFPDSASLRLPNTQGQRPRTVEIDCLVGNDALEIKWKDATTDGDHITKEHTRIKVISDAGYKPIRIMFYYPHRTQAIRIQETLETLYNGVHGEYHYGEAAWDYVLQRTSVNLKVALEQIADSRTNEAA